MVEMVVKFVKVSIGDWGRLTCLLGLGFEASAEDVIREVERMRVRDRDAVMARGGESRKGRRIDK